MTPNNTDSSYKASVLATVQQDGGALYYASNELKKDREVVLAAVKQYGEALKFASNELKKDREVVLAAVKQDGLALLFASDELRADKDVVLAAVKKHGLALKHASDGLQKDREIVLAAVKQDGEALKHASDELRNDKEIVLAAVKQYGLALKFASDELQKDRNFILKAVGKNDVALYFIHSNLRQDRNFILEAIQQNAMALGVASPDLKKDEDVVLAAVRQNVSALQYAYSKLQLDKYFILKVVEQNGLALEYVSPDLKKDEDVVLAAVRQNISALQYAYSKLQQDRGFISKVVKQNGEALQLASDELKKDLEVVLAAVDQNPFAIIYQKDQAIGFTTEEDLQIHLKAFQRQAEILETIPPQELKQYKKLHEQHVKHFEQLSSNNIDCLSRMFPVSKKDPGAIRALLLRNDILKKELNDCLLDCFKIATQYIQGTTQPVTQSSLKETLLTDLPFVKMILHDFTDTQKEKWNGFISFLQTKGLVQDDELKNLVLPTRNKPSQSASSGSTGVFNSWLGLLTPTSKTTQPLSDAREPLLGRRTGAAEPQPIVTGSSSGTRGGEYPSVVFAPQPRGNVFAPPSRTGAASSNEDPRSR